MYSFWVLSLCSFRFFFFMYYFLELFVFLFCYITRCVAYLVDFILGVAVLLGLSFFYVLFMTHSVDECHWHAQ